MILNWIAILLATSFLTVAGCTTAQGIVGPDGTENQLISCPSVERCYEKANQVCGGPYKIINTSTDTSGYKGSTSTTVKLLVKCGR